MTGFDLVAVRAGTPAAAEWEAEPARGYRVFAELLARGPGEAGGGERGMA